MTKISEKNFDQEKNDITFSEVTPKRSFTSAYRCVACHNHDMFHIASSFLVNWLFYDIFLKFLLSVPFLFFVKHLMLLKTYRDCLALFLLMPSLTIAGVKLHFRGASQNPMPFLLWLEFFLEILQVPHQNIVLNTCKIWEA